MPQSRTQLLPLLRFVPSCTSTDSNIAFLLWFVNALLCIHALGPTCGFAMVARGILCHMHFSGRMSRRSSLSISIGGEGAMNECYVLHRLHVLSTEFRSLLLLVLQYSASCAKILFAVLNSFSLSLRKIKACNQQKQKADLSKSTNPSKLGRACKQIVATMV